jgi:hypothetical protein
MVMRMPSDVKNTTNKNVNGNFWDSSPGIVAGRGAPPELRICILLANSFDLERASVMIDGTAAICETPSFSVSFTPVKAIS